MFKLIISNSFSFNGAENFSEIYEIPKIDLIIKDESSILRYFKYNCEIRLLSFHYLCLYIILRKLILLLISSSISNTLESSLSNLTNLLCRLTPLN